MALRIPAIIPRQPAPAPALASDPSAALEDLFNKVWETSMRDLPFVNPALRVQAIGFRKVQGDWIGAVVSPWFLNLCLLPGGGALWQDIPTGEHRQLQFPAGPLEFIAENTPDGTAPIAAYQYCPLIAPVQHIPDQAAAVAAAEAALRAAFTPPPATEGDETTADGHEAPARSDERAPQRPSRRAFWRGGPSRGPGKP